MTDLLADYGRKRAWADAHAQEIGQVVNRFVKGPPDLVPGKFDVDRRQYVFEWPRPLPDPDLALIVGDCIYNLRAALDYLVTALVRSTGNQESNSTAFPIYVPHRGESWFDVGPRWESDAKLLKGALRGTPPQTKALLQELQPFHGVPAVDPDAHPLTILRALSNTDKHRRLNLLASRVDVTFMDPNGQPMFKQPAPHGSTAVPQGSKSDTQILTLNIPPGESEVEMYLRASYDVIFDEAGPPFKRSVIDTLAGIREFIDGRVVPTIRILLGS